MTPIPAPAETVDPHGLLDAENRAMVERLMRDPFLDPAFTVPQMREAFEAFYRQLNAEWPRTADSRDVTIPGRRRPVPLRIYHPRDGAEGPRGLLVFIHGGGSIMGGLDSFDAVCQGLCSGSGAVVVSVDYGLSPEHPYEHEVDDCHDALVWAHANARELGVDPDRIAVAGESGGGGVAATLAMMVRDHGGPQLRLQVLMYPFVGSRAPSASMRTFAKGYFFDAEDLQMFIALNFPDRATLEQWRVSPVWAERFDRLPPAFMVLAEADILRDDADDFARRLGAAGTPVEVRRYDGVIHGFIAMAAALSSGRKALADCAAAVRKALQPGAAHPA